MNIRRSLSIVWLSLLLISSLAGCSKATYKADVAPSDITAAVVQKITVPEGYSVYDDDFLSFYIPDVVSLVDAYHVVYATAPNDYTEVGVLRLKDMTNLEKAENAVQTYLDDFRTTYQPQAEQYDPSERQKLKDAGYQVFGSYLVYTIMTSETQTTCYEIVDGMLKAD